VPSMHPWLVRGVSTCAFELFRARPELELVYVPIGLGSGICAAMRALFSDTHNAAEGAGAAALAACLKEPAEVAGRSVGVLLTGGNVDRELFAAVLAEKESS